MNRSRSRHEDEDEWREGGREGTETNEGEMKRKEKQNEETQ